MSLENEDQNSSNKPAETVCGSQKNLKISYTRDFLLSLSESDVCKKLPSGFDRSLLSEFGDASCGIQDRQRTSGSLTLQSFRRSDYSSSPPTRGDSSNYSRGVYGRWERTSGQNDKDSDSQSDRDSDPGWRYGNLSRRSWQSSEHDGLLGSGSFPRPSGYTPGLSAPKARGNDHYQLNRSNEPYHPPRPYKAVPYPRRDGNDSYNDETFGSTEFTSQDKAEEERRRRASFELMRKEQQKALQEQQKLNADKDKADISDISAFLEDTRDEKRVSSGNVELDEALMPQASNNDSSKSSFPSLVPASRPLVPPGFTSTIGDKSSGIKSSIHSYSAEAGKSEIMESLSHAKTNSLQNAASDKTEERKSAKEMDLSEQQHDRVIRSPFLNMGEKVLNSSSTLEVANKNLGIDEQQNQTSSLLEAKETVDGGEVSKYDTGKVTGNKIIGESNRDHSRSILEELFSRPTTMNIGASVGVTEHIDNQPLSVVQHNDAQPDETWSSSTVQSSKFAHWFLEDEKKLPDEIPSARSSDLLSLIVGGEKSGSQVSNIKASRNILPDFPYQSSELTNRQMTSDLKTATIGISETLHINKQDVVPTVLTCEDLEQTILSEFSGSSSTSQQAAQSWSVTGAKIDQSEAGIDNQASQLLLSLLQKGTNLKDMIPSPSLDIESSDKLHGAEVTNIGSTVDIPVGACADDIQNSGKTLTLETLFGTAFMKELQSGEAPVSVQRGSVGSGRTDVSEPHGLSYPVINDGLFPASGGEIGSNRLSSESSFSASNHRQQAKSDKIENWLGFKDPQIEVNSSKVPTEVVPKLGGYHGAVEIQLPEEESLITVGDPVNPQRLMFRSSGNSNKGELVSSNTSADIAEKLGTLNPVFKDERSMVGREGMPFVHGPYDSVDHEIPYGNPHAQHSSTQFRLPQMNHERPPFHPLDSLPSHINSQLKFMSPERIIHHDTPPNHQFSGNMLHPPFHNPDTGLTGFDLFGHRPMLQKMQMSGNFTPPQLLRELPRGVPLPHQPADQATGMMQEPNPMQGFPFGHPQQNFGGLGMPQPAPDVGTGSNHPEAFQRLMEMELRANAKQTFPFAAARHSQGMYGHELDMGFRYR